MARVYDSFATKRELIQQVGIGPSQEQGNSNATLEQEDISSQISGTNTTFFTISKQPNNSNIILTLNGQVLTSGLNKDYVLNGQNITINNNNHIDISDELIVTYIN